MLYLHLLVAALFASVRARRDLVLENLALRHQLAVYTRGRRRPRLRRHDRRLWSLLARGWSGWRGTLVMVEPDTVVRWHRSAWRDCTDGFGWDVGRPPRHAPANAERSAGPVSESQVSCKLRAPCGTGGPSSHCWRWSTCRSRPPQPSTLEMEAPANPLHQSANRASIAIASPPPSYTASWDGSGKIPHEWAPDIPDTPEPNPFRRARPGQRLRECSPLHVPPSQRRAAARKTALGLGEQPSALASTPAEPCTSPMVDPVMPCWASLSGVHPKNPSTAL